MVASCTPHSHSGWSSMDSLGDPENMRGIGDFECMKGSVHLECMGHISHFEGIVSSEFVRSKSDEGRHFVNRNFVVEHDDILLGIWCLKILSNFTSRKILIASEIDHGRTERWVLRDLTEAVPVVEESEATGRKKNEKSEGRVHRPIRHSSDSE
nr:hypothetical protein Iba_chr01fCG7620 [Ipomoea batatas]